MLAYVPGHVPIWLSLPSILLLPIGVCWLCQEGRGLGGALIRDPPPPPEDCDETEDLNLWTCAPPPELRRSATEQDLEEPAAAPQVQVVIVYMHTPPMCETSLLDVFVRIWPIWS